MLVTLLCLLVVILSTALWTSIKRNFDFIDRLEEIDEKVQSASQVLKEIHADIEQKSKIEVFFDEPVVRDLLKSMMNAKEAVNSVAQLLDDVTTESDQEEREET